jgi:hypothetical protein
MPSDRPTSPPESHRRANGRWRALSGLLALVAVIVAIDSAVFHALMAREGQTHSAFTGIYWTLETMTTLGLGDIAFQSDLGRAFSTIVLMTGVILLFVLLPFTLIQFVYAPWLEARNAARTPRVLPPSVSGHIILTAHGPVEAALIQRLEQRRSSRPRSTTWRTPTSPSPCARPRRPFRSSPPPLANRPAIC